MKNILVVGFGNMGCRHVQSFLSERDNYSITVFEPSSSNIENNCSRIGCKPSDLLWLSDLDDLQRKIDLAIVATSSSPRYDIVKKLLNKGVKFFLLEKVVFQSDSQFEEVIQIMAEQGAKAYCNFVMRYSSAYNIIRNDLQNQNSPIRMIVNGGFWGLGCNSIHYTDIFEYIRGEKKSLHLRSSHVSVAQQSNKRGNIYKEFVGIINLEDSKMDNLVIISDEDSTNYVTITISTSTKTYILNEQTEQLIVLNTINHQIDTIPFKIPPSSQVTRQIVKDIFEGTCCLTQLHNTHFNHNQLFIVFNKVLFGYNSNELLCPIT